MEDVELTRAKRKLAAAEARLREDGGDSSALIDAEMAKLEIYIHTPNPQTNQKPTTIDIAAFVEARKNALGLAAAPFEAQAKIIQSVAATTKLSEYTGWTADVIKTKSQKEILDQIQKNGAQVSTTEADTIFKIANSGYQALSAGAKAAADTQQIEQLLNKAHAGTDYMHGDVSFNDAVKLDLAKPPEDRVFPHSQLEMEAIRKYYDEKFGLYVKNFDALRLEKDLGIDSKDAFNDFLSRGGRNQTIIDPETHETKVVDVHLPIDILLKMEDEQKKRLDLTAQDLQNRGTALENIRRQNEAEASPQEKGMAALKAVSDYITGVKIAEQNKFILPRMMTAVHEGAPGSIDENLNPLLAVELAANVEYLKQARMRAKDILGKDGDKEFDQIEASIQGYEVADDTPSALPRKVISSNDDRPRVGANDAPVTKVAATTPAHAAKGTQVADAGTRGGLRSFHPNLPAEEGSPANRTFATRTPNNSNFDPAASA